MAFFFFFLNFRHRAVFSVPTWEHQKRGLVFFRLKKKKQGWTKCGVLTQSHTASRYAVPWHIYPWKLCPYPL